MPHTAKTRPRRAPRSCPESDPIKLVELDLIDANPNQPRKVFNSDALEELAASIEENGLIQPITLKETGDGRYQIVAGERRYRAHRMLADRGYASVILAIVKTLDTVDADLAAIIENDVRQDVSPLEQAKSYQRMIDEHGFTVDTLAVKLGKPVFRLNERLALLRLTDDCQFLLSKDHITPTQAWYLSEHTPAGQAKLLKAIQIGQCPTTAALKTVSAAIKDAEAQVALFELPKDEPTAAQRQAARSFERKIESVAEMLRQGIADNEIQAVKLVDAGRAGTMADLLAAMQKDLCRIENALRVVAVQQALAA